MPHQNRSSKLRWTSTLLSLCLLAGAISGSLGVPNSSYAQSTPPLSAEQTTALAEAMQLNEQVVQLYQQGKFNEAVLLAKQVLAIRQRILGENHPDVAQSLNNLAELYRNQRRYAEAEPLLKQALELYKRILGENHPYVATSLNNLAGFYTRLGRYVEAEPLFKQALELGKRSLGENHLLKEALELFKSSLSENHPNVADGLTNLAGLYKAQGRYSEAEPLYKQALELRKRSLSESFNKLASLYESKGDSRNAIAFLSQGMQIQEQNLGINLVVGAEQQKRDYIATISATTDAAISFDLQAATSNPDAARLALTTILQRKGRILDALTDNLNRLRQNLIPADQTLLDELNRTRTQLATLYYGGLGKLSPEQYKDRITQLQQQSTQLEAVLNNRSAEFRTENQPITLEAVQKQIPADAALVELVSYKPFNPKAKPADRFGKPRYAAYILSSQGTIQAVDLGEAAAIDIQAEAFRQALRSRDSRVKAIARQLDAKLMQPIRAKLGNTHHLLLSPDSQLNLIPFAALVDEQNRYLVETTDINYLTSGRDLLRLQTPIANRQPPVLMANPDYADPGDPASAQLVREGRDDCWQQSSRPCCIYQAHCGKKHQPALYRPRLPPRRGATRHSRRSQCYFSQTERRDRPDRCPGNRKRPQANAGTPHSTHRHPRLFPGRCRTDYPRQSIALSRTCFE